MVKSTLPLRLQTTSFNMEPSKVGSPSSSTFSLPHLLLFSLPPLCSSIVGIFRVPGTAAVMKRMQATVDKGDLLPLDDFKVLDVAAFLKLYFRSLPDSLFPNDCWRYLSPPLPSPFSLLSFPFTIFLRVLAFRHPPFPLGLSYLMYSL